MIETERRDAASLRVPAVEEGRALVVTRYDEEKAVVMHPRDFRRLASIAAALDDLADGIEMSPLALEAHRIADEPGEPVEDAARIKALLGL